MRLDLVIVVGLIAGCGPVRPAPESLCDVPQQTLASWTGVDVRWQGVIVGGGQHGYSLVAENCWRRGISLDGFAGSSLEKAMRDYALKDGLLRADVSGRIAKGSDEPKLQVTEVHRVSFEPMSVEEHHAYWERALTPR